MSIDLKYQVPTVCVHTNMFHAVTKSVVRVNGAPRMRQVYIPHPVMGKTEAELRAYIEGNSPQTGRPVMQEIVEGLTEVLTDEDLKGLTFERSTQRLCDPATEDELNQLFLDNDWTDKLPIILPTEARVAEMLEHTTRKPSEIVGHMAATHFREYWEYTVEKVAVNAVMAGARPEYFPLILALAASGVSARGSSTSSMASMAVVNGPIRQELEMNSGTGAMGPYNHANATIGRAFGLLSQNLQGSSVPGHTYMGSQGNNYAYNSITFAENEERSPWEPLHVQRGFKPTDSVVSVFGGCQSTAFTLGLRREHWQDHVRNMLRGMDPNGAVTLLLDPITARLFMDIGGAPAQGGASSANATAAPAPRTGSAAGMAVMAGTVPAAETVCGGVTAGDVGPVSIRRPGPALPSGGTGGGSDTGGRSDMMSAATAATRTLACCDRRTR